MKKRIAAIVTALALCLSLSASALAVGLTAIRDYSSSDFTDVRSDWSKPYITACYELGLMSGQGEGRFAPDGTVTVAEGITVAARVHDLWLGGEGEIPGGEPWYAGAVDYVLEHGLMTEGEFPDYTATATRAQLAGLLARALPEEDYAAINSIASLPDVTASTPYADGILKLYNAGVLTGSDEYGTFSPGSNITRAELAAILCRLVRPDDRVSLTLAEKPADLTVRTSSKRLYISGVPMVGLVEIDGKYYIPSDVLNDDYYSYSTTASFSELEEYYQLSFRGNEFRGEVTALDLWSFPPDGQALGVAAPAAKPLWYNGGDIYGAVYTLDGRYPMISLDALGATTDGTSFYLDLGADPANYTLVTEGDVTGGRVSLLFRSTPRETVTAIHDYIVNNLTYDLFYQAPWGTTQAEYDAEEAAYNAACEKYKLGNNITLVAGYGVCQDYAELFRTMCIRAGVPCVVVRGEPDHSWNMVYVDGQWLYVDCTWDDPVSRTPTLKHDYLFIDAERLAKDHYWTGDDYPLPDEYDPAWEQLDPNNITSADMFRKCLVAQLMQKKTSITLRVTKSGAYGGTGCIYAYPAGWWTFSGGYNSSTGTYQYTVEY